MSTSADVAGELTDRIDGKVPALELAGVSAGYGSLKVLDDVSLRVHEGELVGLFGANGAGKTTTVKTAAGLLKPTSGEVRLLGANVSNVRAERRIRQGLAVVPEGRHIFQEMSVHENLLMGSYSLRSKSDVDEQLDQVFTRFPFIADRHEEMAGNFSGGQQQILAVARALMSRPTTLLLDEPSMGVAPIVVDEIFTHLRRLADDGMAILVVEQNLATALNVADRGYVVERGRIVLHGTAAELLSNPSVQAAYLGIDDSAPDAGGGIAS